MQVCAYSMIFLICLLPPFTFGSLTFFFLGAFFIFIFFFFSFFSSVACFSPRLLPARFLAVPSWLLRDRFPAPLEALRAGFALAS